jgi:glycosyltransferase involved in cell wall biosynthesis
MVAEPTGREDAAMKRITEAEPTKNQPPGTPFATWLAERSRGPMTAHSVLFHAPSHVFQAPGGGECQLVQTGRHLEDLGLRIRLFSPWTDRLDRARLLHLFGMSREGLELAREARSRGVAVVLSPICWYEPGAIAALAPSISRACGDLARWVMRRTAPRCPSWRRALLQAADAILPNSDAEARQLVRLFGVDRRRIRVVPNGVEPRLSYVSPDRFRACYGAEPFVLYVGRVEPRKNVLGLIRAVRTFGMPLVVLGESPPGHDSYALACRRAGGDAVRWLGRVDHHDPMLASAYAAARVFALPSWFETPGLAALEAALAGTAVVVTPFGCTREYFGDRVEYARPDRPGAIARAVARAWHDGPDRHLAAHVAAHFLWSNAAQCTAEVYDQVAS